MAEMDLRRRETGSIKNTMGQVDASALYSLVRIVRPQIVVETGTNRGASTAFILKALHDAGCTKSKVISIEYEDGPEVGMLIPQELRANLKIVKGDIRDLILDQKTIPSEIDFFLHDSSHKYEHQFWEFTQFWPLISSGGILASHDVDLNSSFSTFVTQTYHHISGKTDPSKTTHADWGRCGKLGFIQKRVM